MPVIDEIYIRNGTTMHKVDSINNQAIEEIFFLAASVSEKNVKLLILPFDFRKRAVPDQIKFSWLKERYCRLAAAVCKFPVEKMDMLL